MIKYSKVQGRFGNRVIVYLCAPWKHLAWDISNDEQRLMRPAVFIAFDRIRMLRWAVQIQFGLTYCH